MQPNKEHAVDCACGCRYPSLDLTEVYVTSAQSRCPCFLVSTPYFSPSRLVFMSTKGMVEPEHGEPITKHAHNRTHDCAHSSPMPLRSDHSFRHPRQPRHRHLADVSPVANPGKHAPVSCTLMPYDASDSPLIIFCC